MRKRLVIVNVAVALAMVLSFTAFRGSQVSAARTHATTTVTLDGWASTPSEPNDLKKVISKFEHKNPSIHVQYNVINGPFETQMKAAFAAGRGPDVLYADEGWAQDFERTHAFQSLNKFINKDKSFHFSDLYPGIVKGFTINKKVYGIPKDYSTLALWYNTKIFKKLHIKHAPTDVKSFARVACEIRRFELKHHHKNRYGAGLPNDQARWQPILQAFGGHVMNGKQTKPKINSHAGVKAIKWWTGLVKRGCAAEPSQVGAGWSGQEFGQKNAAMVFEGPWLLTPMQTQWTSVHWKLAPLPTGPKGNGNLAFSVAYAMNAHSHVKSASWKLISFLTGRQGEKMWVHLFKVLPARRSIKPPKGDGVFVKGAAYAEPWSFKPGYFNPGGPNATLNNDLDKVALHGMSPKAMAKDVAKAIKLWLSHP